MNETKPRFFLFGMGNRRKLIFIDNRLYDITAHELIRSFDGYQAVIRPDRYAVSLRSPSGQAGEIFENETGVYLMENGVASPLTESSLRLPSFEGHPYEKTLRVLHHELLINIVDGRPLPNLFVYKSPWYRDGAMVCMALEHTRNLDLVKPWIRSLSKPYDQNNGGCREPDNLGQLLYLLSLAADASHPMVPAVLDEAKRHLRDGVLTGITDGEAHPVYQTKWLKFGLKKLHLPDSCRIPQVEDSYSSLFWMDYRDQHVPHSRFEPLACERYPYLQWAQAHFYREQIPPLPKGNAYPLTYETCASQADYRGNLPFLPEYLEKKLAAPHTWHAAEMFLYLIEEGM